VQAINGAVVQPGITTVVEGKKWSSEASKQRPGENSEVEVIPCRRGTIDTTMNRTRSALPRFGSAT
jgi:hypothetical protein